MPDPLHSNVSSIWEAGTGIDIIFVEEEGEYTVITVESTGGPGGSAHTIKEDGTPLTDRSGLNFGNGLLATDDAGNDETDVRVDYGAVVTETAFGQASTNGALASVSRSDHTHGTPTDPVTAHVAAGDPHTAYLKEESSGGLASEVPDHTHVSGAQGGVIDRFVQAALFTGGSTQTGVGTQNDLALSATNSRVRWDGDGVSDATWTGITGGADGRIFWVINSADNPGVDLILAHNNAGSSASNRFDCPGAVDFTLRRFEAVVIFYDSNSSRWRVIADTSGLSTHEAAADPHTGYLKEADVAAKGDLYVASADNTVSVVTVGANDTILMADSAQGNGVKWQAPATTSEIADIADSESAGSSDTWARGDHVHSGAAYRKEADVQHLITFSKTGNLSVGTGTLRWYNDTGVSITLDSARGSVGTAPTTQSILVDVNNNGTSVWNATQANRITIAAGTNTDEGGAFDDTTIADGEYLTVDIDQVGSGTVGADLTVSIWGHWS